MPKVSIIVPIYNVEKYLEKGITSLIKQTLGDIEIILVNDGSSDGSLSICRMYEQLDPRIKVVDKPNGGVSSARNEGLKIATGDYIGFIDPDDWVEEDMYYNMFEQAQSTHSEVVLCNYSIDHSQGIEYVKIPVSKNLLSKKDIEECLIPQMLGRKDLNNNEQIIMGSVWRLLVKRQVVEKKKIYFKVGLPLMEDLLWCIELFLNVNQISINDQSYYHYVLHDNSTVRKYRNDIYQVQIDVFNYLEELLKRHNLYKQVEMRMNIRYVTIHISSIINEVHIDSPKNTIVRIACINKLCKNEKLKKILRDIDMGQYSIRKKILLRAIKFQIGVYLYAYYSAINRVLK